MDIFVLRHGRAGSWNPLRYPDDRLRPLTREGQDRLGRQVLVMEAIEVCPEVIVSSPLTRALQTAQIVHRGLDNPRPLATSDALTPGADPYDTLEELATDYASFASVMIVGHEPHLSGFTSVAVAGSHEPIIRIRKGALCKISLQPSAYGHTGWIEWSLTARQMLRLARQ